MGALDAFLSWPPTVPKNAPSWLVSLFKQFATLVEGLAVHGEWMTLKDFWKAVMEPCAQTKRYLDGKTLSSSWRVVGKPPRVKKDWKMLQG